MNEQAPGNEGLSAEPWQIRPGIQGYIWRAAEPRAALLLQHGFGEYAQRYVRQYSELIPRLLSLGVSIYGFDMEGHGHSEGRRGTVDVHRAVEDHLSARRALREDLTARRAMREDLTARRAVREDLTARRAVRDQPAARREDLDAESSEQDPRSAQTAGKLPLFVLGHSLGGLVTAGSLARDQRGVSGAIIMSAAFPTTNPIMRSAARLLAKIVPNAPAPTPAARVKGISRIPEEVETYRNDPMIYHGLIPNRVAATALAVTRSVYERSAEWTVPTLILHGTADQATDPEGSRKLYETIASDDKTLHTVEGGYHELLNDLDRDETLRLLLEWLEQRLPESARHRPW